ncbi:MAG: hypothetical protein ACLTD2_02600 [Ruminococcus sp.]
MKISKILAGMSAYGSCSFNDVTHAALAGRLLTEVLMRYVVRRIDDRCCYKTGVLQANVKLSRCYDVLMR